MTGNIEGVHFLASNTLLPLSEQQLTSCDRTGDDGGCKGSATVLDTFKYVVDNGGIASELGYPLCSANYTCPPAPGCDPESGKNSCKKQRKSGVCNDQLESRPVANIRCAETFNYPYFPRFFSIFSRFPRDFWPCSLDSWRPDGENGRKMGETG